MELTLNVGGLSEEYTGLFAEDDWPISSNNGSYTMSKKTFELMNVIHALATATSVLTINWAGL